MAEEDAKILGTWSSPFVMRTMIALNLKGVEYQMIEETASPKSELLLKVNPVYKKIPVLIHANRPVCESLITVQYIDEAWSFGPTILPSDPYERAMARFWGAYIDDEGLAKWAERFWLDTAVKDLMPDAEKLAGFFKVLAARYKAIAPAATAQT